MAELARLESVCTGNRTVGSNPTPSAMFTTYILKSIKDGSYYYGNTKDLSNRLKMHNSGKVKYTKSKMPWIVQYTENFESRSEALKREKFFKTIDGYKWLKDNSIT